MKNIENEKNSFYSFLKHERRLSENSFISYKNDLEQYLRFCEANHFSLEDSGSVRFWIMELVEAGIKERSVNRKISSLNTFFKFLLSRDSIAKSPMENIESLSTPKQLPNYVLDEKMEQIFDIYQDKDLEKDRMLFQEYLIIELFYGTGIRLAELIGLKLSDFSYSASHITVLGKGNKQRIVPLHKVLLDKMQRYVELFADARQEFFFLTEKKEKLYPKYVYRLVNKVIGQVSSQKKKSPHVLRHSFATEMLNNGAELNTIKEILGHANLAATQIYTHNSIEQLKQTYQDAFKKIDN